MIEPDYEAMTDEELRGQTDEFRKRLDEGESIDAILPEAFATVREACRRLMGTTVMVTGQPIVWNMVPYDVQLIGGINLHRGRIAEMATGEGKTLVATLPLYLNALPARGAPARSVPVLAAPSAAICGPGPSMAMSPATTPATPQRTTNRVR